ncbi:MAG TPA: hypothetical protein PKD72_14150 [Gemmatales bacterium]|nr:hypothetical protein [Gemmatales bacterium]
MRREVGMPPPDGVPTSSVQSEGLREALTHRWILSEKAGRDLGEECIRRWVHDHWNGFLRARWMEHLQGKTYWMELDRTDFGLLAGEFQEDEQLLDRILERMKEGKENLDVIQWALDWGIPVERVVHILERLNVNSSRLSCQFYQQ